MASSFADDELFKEPPPREECPICMLTLPIHTTEQRYQPCCGKILCTGCIYAAFQADNRRLCPFCRIPEANSEGEALLRIKKRAEANDAVAIHQLGGFYCIGENSIPQDYNKAIELWLRAGELGCAAAYDCVADMYDDWREKEAKHYYELAAMAGWVRARHNLGSVEARAGNMERAMKHLMISAGAGFDDSLKGIRVLFMNGHATKDDFENALRAHKAAKDQMKSAQRDAAAARRVQQHFASPMD